MMKNTIDKLTNKFVQNYLFEILEKI